MLSCNILKLLNLLKKNLSHLNCKNSKHYKFLFSMSILKFYLVWQLLLGNCHWYLHSISILWILYLWMPVFHIKSIIIRICRNIIKWGHFRPRKEYVQEDVYGWDIGNCSKFMICTRIEKSAVRLEEYVRARWRNMICYKCWQVAEAPFSCL